MNDSWPPQLPSLPNKGMKINSFQRLMCPFYLRPDFGKSRVSSGNEMTNWCWSLGTVHHLLIHHSKGHINLSNLSKPPSIAWLEPTHLHPTPTDPLPLSHFWKHVCQRWPSEEQLVASLYSPVPPRLRRSRGSPELYWKVRACCPLSQQFPKSWLKIKYSPILNKWMMFSVLPSR